MLYILHARLNDSYRNIIIWLYIKRDSKGEISVLMRTAVPLDHHVLDTFHCIELHHDYPRGKVKLPRPFVARNINEK